MVDALTRIVRAADQIGIAVVLLDVLNCGDPELVARRKASYLRFGFMELPSQPLHLFCQLGWYGGWWVSRLSPNWFGIVSEAARY